MPSGGGSAGAADGAAPAEVSPRMRGWAARPSCPARGKGCFTRGRCGWSGSGTPAVSGRLRLAAGAVRAALPPEGPGVCGAAPPGPPAPLGGSCGAGSAAGAAGEGASEDGSSHAVPACAGAARAPSRPRSAGRTLEGPGEWQRCEDREEWVSWEGGKWNSALPAVTKRSGLAEKVERHQNW